jgi:hypothetical protein
LDAEQSARALQRRLASEIEDDLRAIETIARAIERLGPAAPDERGEWMRGLALAFEIERYYTAVESVFVRILRLLDGDVPSGPSWHLELLRSVSLDIEGCRPAVISRSTADELREILKFRHLARHGYEREPELPKMVEHAERVARAHPSLAASLTDLASWLRR